MNKTSQYDTGTCPSILCLVLCDILRFLIDVWSTLRKEHARTLSAVVKFVRSRFTQVKRMRPFGPYKALHFQGLNNTNRRLKGAMHITEHIVRASIWFSPIAPYLCYRHIRLIARGFTPQTTPTHPCMEAFVNRWTKPDAIVQVCSYVDAMGTSNGKFDDFSVERCRYSVLSLS